MGILLFLYHNSYSFVCVKYNSKDDSGIIPKNIMCYIVGEKGKSLTYILHLVSRAFLHI